MPTSSPEHKKTIKKIIEKINPELIVDVGPGEGTYSDLLKGKYRMIGIEVWAPYIRRYNLDKKYEKVIVGDIRYIDLNLVAANPDLVILGDVLEHLTREHAMFLIFSLQRWAKNIIVSLPLNECPQGEWEGNWFERHLSTWSHDDMLKLMGDKTVLAKEGNLLGLYWWSNDKGRVESSESGIVGT